MRERERERETEQKGREIIFVKHMSSQQIQKIVAGNELIYLRMLPTFFGKDAVNSLKSMPLRN